MVDWWDTTKDVVINNLNEILIGIILIICVIVACVWIVIIHTAFKLHEAKTVGKAKESVCGEFYLEGESARESIYEAYISEDGGAEKLLKNVVELLVVLMGSLMMMLLIYGVLIFKKDPFSFRQFLGFTKEDWPKLFFIYPLITTIVLWFVYYYNSPQDATINPFSDVLFRAGQTFSEEEKSKLIGRQAGFIIGFGILLIIYVALLFKYDLWTNQSSVFNVFLMVYIILAIFIPFLSSEVYTLNSKVRAYYSSMVAGTDLPSATTSTSSSVNAMIRGQLNNTLFNNNLRNNIRSLHGLPEVPTTLEDNQNNPYLYKLYRYVLNGVNMAEIRNITIPEELMEFIDPVYLRGENILILKYDFLKFYNSRNLSSDFDMYVKKYLKDDYKKAVCIRNDSTSLTCTTLKSTTEPCPSSYNVNKCQRVISAVTKYILQNDTYKLNNIVPIEIRSKLQDVRTNTQMEDTVQGYFNTVNSLSIFLFVIVSYLIFHKFYLENTEYMLARTSLIMLVLLIIIGLVGWLFKDLWL